MPSEGGTCLQTAFPAAAHGFRAVQKATRGIPQSRRLRRMPHFAPRPCFATFPTYLICSERIDEKEKNTAAGNLFGGFVCLYGDGGPPAPGK
ncbi:hypothetical protein [Neisseria bergeri]|uniref:hypothetical protein n=1 Tax=Neisseria bergeri TaxID=1906581 RepID=UPI0027DF88E7|nr:hypothetical protein [Neisseria bergeri]